MANKKELNKLSNFEWEIIQIIWASKGKSTVRDIYERLSSDQDRAYTTVQTYMERLVEKKYLKKKKIGMVNFYSAKITEEVTLKNEANTFVKNAFDNSFGKLAAFLFDSDSLSNEDIDKIKKMIEEKEKK